MRTMAAIVALLFVSSAGATYKCVDEQGHTIVSFLNLLHWRSIGIEEAM